MKFLELLAPARNADIGIAAIACGADAVYIGGPGFGARKDAGNTLEEVKRLCDYAHIFGARVFLTVNVTVEPEEMEEVHSMMLHAQEIGVDAFIVRDLAITRWTDITIPLHASTQCAIRTVEKAKEYASEGFSRLVLERELTLERVREIASECGKELEFFVHGALCVCYSGDCYLSENISGRSANKGECIQACRSLYDLTDKNGKVLVQNKALLSLKDYNLKDRLEDLAQAGVSSFKIEGRLKNASYVKNVVREYSIALDNLIARNPDKYARASFGRVSGGFTPDSTKTFNRGYTQLYLDGKRGQWSSMNAPKSMGEVVGTVTSVRKVDSRNMEVEVRPFKNIRPFVNGDGFSFVSGHSITGFRGDVCQGYTIRCKTVTDLHKGDTLYRNLNTAFEKELETNMCRRSISAGVDITIKDGYIVTAKAFTEDGRSTACEFTGAVQSANNADRMVSMIEAQISKSLEPYSFRLHSLEICTSDGSLPLLSASELNGIRRLLAERLNCMPCNKIPMDNAAHLSAPAPAEVRVPVNGELMRSKYCVRYELGMCPVHQGAKDSGPLFLLNNGRRFALGFDCRNCEMTLKEA